MDFIYFAGRSFKENGISSWFIGTNWTEKERTWCAKSQGKRVWREVNQVKSKIVRQNDQIDVGIDSMQLNLSDKNEDTINVFYLIGRKLEEHLRSVRLEEEHESARQHNQVCY